MESLGHGSVQNSFFNTFSDIAYSLANMTNDKTQVLTGKTVAKQG